MKKHLFSARCTAEMVCNHMSLWNFSFLRPSLSKHGTRRASLIKMLEECWLIMWFNLVMKVSCHGPFTHNAMCISNVQVHFYQPVRCDLRQALLLLLLVLKAIALLGFSCYRSQLSIRVSSDLEKALTHWDTKRKPHCITKESTMEQYI